MATRRTALDLGAMQGEVEASTTAFKAAMTAYAKAAVALEAAEIRYHQAQKALINGVGSLRAGTKIV